MVYFVVSCDIAALRENFVDRLELRSVNKIFPESYDFAATL
jgi:hypothetical protein